MSVADIPNLVEVLAAHVWRGGILGCQCGWDWPEERTYACGEDERITAAHVAHVADAWWEACTIRTAEQLAALNERTDSLTGPLVKSNAVKLNDGTGATGLGGVLEGNGDGTWNYDGGGDLTANQVALPALLIWHPRWSA